MAAALAIGLYANTLSHGYVLDDRAAVLENQYVQQGLSGIPRLMTVDWWHFQNVHLGYYRPLSLITFAVEHQFFGNDPLVSHLGNILLYGLTAFLLTLLLSRLLGARPPGVAVVAALLFVAHPVHTEVVANIKSRDELLSFLSITLALLLALRAHDTRSRAALAGSLGCLYLALLSKETALVGALLVPALLYFFRGAGVKASLIRAAPYALVVAGFFVQKYLLLGTISGASYDDVINYPYRDPATKLPTALLMLASYVKLLVLPHPLVYDYSFDQVPAAAWASAGAAVGAALAAGLAYFTVRETLRRTTYGFALVLFTITLAPALGFLLLRGGIMAERFLYAPALGYTLLIALGLGRASSGRAGLAAALVLFAAYSVKTVTRNPAWKDNLTLFSTDVAYAPNSCQVRMQYGGELIDQAMAATTDAARTAAVQAGMRELEAAVRINPHFGGAYFRMALAYHRVTKDLDRAIQYYVKTVQEAPLHARAYNNLAILYQETERQELASYYFNRAVEANPAFPEAATNAAAHKKLTGLDVRTFPSVAPAAGETEPGDAAAHYRRGVERVSRGDYAAAELSFKRVIELNPRHEPAYVNLANCYASRKAYELAVELNLQLIAINPRNVRAYRNLAATYSAMGDGEKARAYKEQADRLATP